MTTLAVCSVKQSPGATTAALAACAAWAGTSGDAPVLVELDPAGGDLAARLGVPFDPGLASLAAAARHPGLPVTLADHARPLPCGGTAVLAPTAFEQAASATTTLAARLPVAVEATGGRAVFDCGRWYPGSPATGALGASDLTLVVLHADVGGIDHVRARVGVLREASRERLLLALTAGSPYRSVEVERATGVGVLGVIPRDDRGVTALLGAVQRRGVERSALVRAMRSMLECLSPARERTPRRGQGLRVARA
jgi:hypothetical protein